MLEKDKENIFQKCFFFIKRTKKRYLEVYILETFEM